MRAIAGGARSRAMVRAALVGGVAVTVAVAGMAVVGSAATLEVVQGGRIQSIEPIRTTFESAGDVDDVEADVSAPSGTPSKTTWAFDDIDFRSIVPPTTEQAPSSTPTEQVAVVDEDVDEVADVDADEVRPPIVDDAPAG